MEKADILVFKDLTRKSPKIKRHIDKSLIEEELDKLAKGDEVFHIKFGDGIVAGIDDGIIEIDFFGELKKFPFPDAFTGGFLNL